MAVLKRLYLYNSSDRLFFVPELGAAKGNNHSETKWLRLHMQIALHVAILMAFS